MWIHSHSQKHENSKDSYAIRLHNKRLVLMELMSLPGPGVLEQQPAFSIS